MKVLHLTLATALAVLSGCAATKVEVDPDVEMIAFPGTGKAANGDRCVEVHGTVWNSDFVVGEAVTVLVNAVNSSSRAVGVPASFTDDGRTRMDSAGVGFSRNPGANIMTQFDFINFCPPVADIVAPGETRSYRFVWTPGKDDIGEGFLILHLWPPFEKVQALPITVRAK